MKQATTKSHGSPAQADVTRASSGTPFKVFLVVLAALQIAIVLYYERPSLMFGGKPNAWLDYDTHIEQVWRAVEALEGWGKSWSYDPHLLAGNPNGTIFAADNKGWELWTFALTKLGVPKGIGFNLFLLFAHLSVPWVVFFAARLFDLDRGTSLLAAYMGLVLWYCDSFPRWCWWCGMVAYAMAGTHFLLSLGLFYRYLKYGKIAHIALLALTLAASHLIHPYAFVILVFPMVFLYLAHFKKQKLKNHLHIWSAILFVIGANAYWLIPAVQHWQYMVVIDSGVYAQSTLSFLVSDYLEMMREPVATGVLMPQTSFRFVFLLSAGASLFYWKKESDDRFWPFAIGIVSMLAITYFGGYSSFFTHIQPYRHILPAMYFAVIPAAALVGRVRQTRVLKDLPTGAYALGSLGLLLFFGSVSRNCLYFLPGLLPDPNLRAEEKIALRVTNPRVPGITGRQMDFRHSETFADYDRIAEWVEDKSRDPGRFLVQGWVLGEHLAWRTDAEILGGFRLRNVQHSQANLFRRFDEGEISLEEARQHLIDFAVRWVIFSGPPHQLESYTSLLRPMVRIPPIHRIYETTVPVSLLQGSEGTASASINRIDVRGTHPNKPVVLRYHYHESLVCKEGCRIEREPLSYDPVGLIRVPAPHPADFTIINGY